MNEPGESLILVAESALVAKAVLVDVPPLVASKARTFVVEEPLVETTPKPIRVVADLVREPVVRVIHRPANVTILELGPPNRMTRPVVVRAAKSRRIGHVDGVVAGVVVLVPAVLVEWVVG